jgi:hypothetical protein
MGDRPVAKLVPIRDITTRKNAGSICVSSGARTDDSIVRTIQDCARFGLRGRCELISFLALKYYNYLIHV